MKQNSEQKTQPASCNASVSEKYYESGRALDQTGKSSQKSTVILFPLDVRNKDSSTSRAVHCCVQQLLRAAVCAVGMRKASTASCTSCSSSEPLKDCLRPSNWKHGLLRCRICRLFHKRCCMALCQTEATYSLHNHYGLTKLANGGGLSLL